MAGAYFNPFQAGLPLGVFSGRGPDFSALFNLAQLANDRARGQQQMQQFQQVQRQSLLQALGEREQQQRQFDAQLQQRKMESEADRAAQVRESALQRAGVQSRFDAEQRRLIDQENARILRDQTDAAEQRKLFEADKSERQQQKDIIARVNATTSAGMESLFAKYRSMPGSDDFDNMDAAEAEGLQQAMELAKQDPTAGEAAAAAVRQWRADKERSLGSREARQSLVESRQANAENQKRGKDIMERADREQRIKNMTEPLYDELAALRKRYDQFKGAGIADPERAEAWQKAAEEIAREIADVKAQIADIRKNG